MKYPVFTFCTYLFELSLATMVVLPPFFWNTKLGTRLIVRSLATIQGVPIGKTGCTLQPNLGLRGPNCIDATACRLSQWKMSTVSTVHYYYYYYYYYYY